MARILALQTRGPTVSGSLLDQLQTSLGGTYTIERELGGGGMSRVFVADEPRLGRKVVVKVMSPDLAAGLSVERFEREIRLAASLQQANIVQVLAAGEIGGLPYYTMPFVEGESLRARLTRSGALGIGETIGILRDVARALSYAHDRGVVHRDIKPDNVLLSGGTAVVTDFGIAKAIADARAPLERAQPAGTALTAFGTAIGTPAYMAPEQAAADPSVDHRADLYSFGCMAYELLAGQPPFAGRAPHRILAAHMTEMPQPIAQLRPDTPEPVAELVMGCLEKDPAARPAGASEIVQALESVTSGGLASMPPLLLGGRRPFLEALGVYGAALVAVAILARAAVIGIGLPDWVFPGALAVMALGFPMVLVTGYVQHVARRTVMRTPVLIPGGSPAPQGPMATLAIRASPHVSWHRTWMGGVYALAGFTLLIAGFMILRALGIGPAGSLMAAGRIGAQEPLLVTDFSGSDTALARVFSEAVRTSLAESRAFPVMQPGAVADVLRRMERPPTTAIDQALARELALREGIKAIVDGNVTAIPGGYVLAVQLIGADSLNEMAAFRATIADPTHLLSAADDLTRKLRGRIGESLRTVRATPSLERVTTASFAALQKYAEGSRLNDVEGNPIRAAEVLREAIVLDTTFAMAYRKLGVALNNGSRPRAEVDSALGAAYRFRDRLTERERLVTEGTYYYFGPGRNRARAIEAYEAVLRLDPQERAAANNLANIYGSRRELARAESLYRRAIDGGYGSSQNYSNIIPVLVNQGRLDEAEQRLIELRERFPNVHMSTSGWAALAYARGQVDSADAVYRRMVASSNPIVKINGLGGAANIAAVRGQLAEVTRLGAEARAMLAMFGQPPNPIADSLQRSWLDLSIRHDTARAIRRMEATLARHDIQSLPFPNRPYIGLATFNAMASRPSQARGWAARFDAAIPDSVMRRELGPGRNGAEATLLMNEGRFEDALRAAWRSDTTYDGPSGNCEFCIYSVIGEIYHRAGVADSAIHYWEAWLRTTYYGREGMDGSNRWYVHRRLGELYEERGDITRATEHYLAFVELWKNADAELQPRVAEIRRRIARLNDVEGR